MRATDDIPSEEPIITVPANCALQAAWWQGGLFDSGPAEVARVQCSSISAPILYESSGERPVDAGFASPD